MNTKACKYLLLNGETEKCTKLFNLFSRQGEGDEPVESQCMWLPLHMSRAYYKKQMHAEALLECRTIFKHFRDIHQDQLDFHPYCLRKSTFRAYLAFLRMQDKLHSHRYIYTLQSTYSTGLEGFRRVYEGL